MPSYRLLAGNGTVVEAFDAPSDGGACRYARELARGYECPDARSGARPDLRVERREGRVWRCIFAWVPRAGLQM